MIKPHILEHECTPKLRHESHPYGKFKIKSDGICWHIDLTDFNPEVLFCPYCGIPLKDLSSYTIIEV